MVLNFTACGKVNMMCLKEIAPYTTARIVRGLIEEEIRFTDFKSKEQEFVVEGQIFLQKKSFPTLLHCTVVPEFTLNWIDWKIFVNGVA
ncbi:hypothetical protein T4E_1431 [Trichinella pseudospiralis]|uniref:Uncharacterized protein n=1 Tax=Trichinella pseudospiralis TaxID=6337 RepID=A0A0V0XZV7_TRIPS|nr:hypothetical protein T4E_1431 [Trichinella pseudospiralis]